jgi:cytochrome c-type biogenesis protein CcmH/NrfG
MPPWKPEPGYGDFEGVRRLTDRQVALIERWIEQGSRMGQPEDLPQAPTWTDSWYLGQPDLVITMPQPFEVPATGVDVFRTFVVPIPVTTLRYVKALEFHPGNAKVVHHANIKIDRTRLSRNLDDGEPGLGFAGSGSRKATFPDGYFLGWTPGQRPRVQPVGGLAWRLYPDSDLVVEMHLMPSSTTQYVQASVGLHFTDEAPGRSAYMLRIGRQDIDIAAGQSYYVNRDSFTLPVDVDVLGVQPHAHYLAKEVKGFATLPDGSTKWLIYIRDWDARWQDVYQFATPISLPRGATLTMEYTYDNSFENQYIRGTEPKRVIFGQVYGSEMGTLWIQVLPRTAGDLQMLEKHFSPKLLAEDIAGNEKMLEVSPEDPRQHAALADCYAEAGRADDALRHLRKAVALDPSPLRHYDVGRMLLFMRRYSEAGAAFHQALALRFDMPESFYGLGLAFTALGRLEEAVQAYNRALELDLKFTDAHYNLANVLAALGRRQEAIAHYQQVIQIRPHDAEAIAALDRLRRR